MGVVKGSRLNHIENDISNKHHVGSHKIRLIRTTDRCAVDHAIQLIETLFTMATSLPIPAPPRTPTPPLDDEYQTAGLGLVGVMTSPTKTAFDPNTLSPMFENFPLGRYGALGSAMASPANPLSPTSTNSVYSPMSVDSAGNPTSGSGEDLRGPFNFQTTTLAKSPVARSVCTGVQASKCTGLTASS